MNYRDFLQKVIYAIINPLIKAMIAVGITPNIVTFVGFLGNIVAAGDRKSTRLNSSHLL